MERILGWFQRKELNCDQVRKLSSEYLEGELSPSRLERFRSHISKCGPCRAFVEGLASMLGMLARLSKAEPPATLKQSIIEQIRASRSDGEQGTRP